MLSENDMPPLQLLVAFESAARHLSFTAAAKELGTTQPAISQQMKMLELFLNRALFHRIYRGVELTDEGHILFRTTQSCFSEIRKVMTYIRKKSQSPTIHVATDFAFAAYWLVPRLPDFRKQYPHIDIRLHTAQSNRDIWLQDVDLAIVFSDGIHPGFVAGKLFEEQVFPVCSPRFLENCGPFESLSQIIQAPLLKLDSEPDDPWMTWEKMFQHHHQLWSPSPSTMSFDNYTLLIQAAVAGQGIAIGWGALIDDTINQGLLTALRDFQVRSHYGYYTVIPQSLTSDVVVQTFSDWIHGQNA